MRKRYLSLAVAPAMFMGPCSPPTCGPPPSTIDLTFQCKYPDGVVDFGVENLTGSAQSYVAYDADSGFRLTDLPGGTEFSLDPHGFDIKQFTSEFVLERVIIAPPGRGPNDAGFVAFDTETVGAQLCVTTD